MQDTFENEVAISYTNLFGERKTEHVDIKARWRDEHRGSSQWVLPTQELDSNWLESCHTLEADISSWNSFCDYAAKHVLLDWSISYEHKVKASKILHSSLGAAVYSMDVVHKLPATKAKPSLEDEFAKLVAKWREETRMYSMLPKKIMHPAYQKIIGMGKDALPFIFRELNERGGHWIWALCAITREDAAKPEHNLKQAKEAWLEWGKRHGYV